MSNHAMKLCTYLNFPGNCREAFGFYEKHLGGKIVMMMTHGQNPEPGRLGPEFKDTILHGRIDLGNSMILGADIPGAEPMRSAYLTFFPGSTPEAERIYAALSDGGEIFMPLAETFFAFRFGMLRDKFGANWMILHERPMSQNA
jgi:PhnB protein